MCATSSIGPYMKRSLFSFGGYDCNVTLRHRVRFGDNSDVIGLDKKNHLSKIHLPAPITFYGLGLAANKISAGSWPNS